MDCGISSMCTSDVGTRQCNGLNSSGQDLLHSPTGDGGAVEGVEGHCLDDEQQGHHQGDQTPTDPLIRMYFCRWVLGSQEVVGGLEAQIVGGGASMSRKMFNCHEQQIASKTTNLCW